MEIIYLGHSSFRIKTKGASIVTDPYDPKMVGLKFPKISADIVTVSHEHNDHNRRELVKNVRKIVDGPGEYEIGGVSIVGLPSFHDDKGGSVRGKNTIYILEAESLRLVHLGDLGHKLDESQIEVIGDVDVLMVPVGGEYTIGASTASEIVHALTPKIIIPMHYKMAALNQETFGKLEPIETFLKEVALPVESAEKLVVKGILEETQKVVKLKPVNA